LFNRNAPYHEWLLPYLEGGLDEARRAQVEARLGEDPILAAEAERLRRTLGGLRGAASRTPLSESAHVPADLWPHLRARLVLHPAPRPRTSRAWWVAGVGAPAAAALIVAAFWLPGWHTPDMPPLSHTPPVSSQRPARPPGASVPAHPAPDMPVSTAKPLPTAKSRMVAPTPAPAPIMAGPTPFDLRVPAPPVNHSVNGSLTPPAVSVPPGRPDVSVFRPPRPAAAVAPHILPSPALSPSPAAPKPLLLSPVPPMPTAAATYHGGNSPAPAPDKATADLSGAGGFGGGGMAGPAPGASPREAVTGLDANARLQAKSSPKALLPSSAMLGQVGQPLPAPRRNRAAPHRAPKAPANALQTFDANAQGGLESWQAALSAAVQLPLWGETDGEQQAGQALMAAREAGGLDDLRARLEARRAQAPQDVVMGRMLAAVYDFGGSPEAALRERRRIAGLEGAVGEDWYALAHAEEGARNGPAARAAYRRALESPIQPSPFHAALARQKD